jgi:DNA-binding NarL/FixJ family response regulator
MTIRVLLADDQALLRATFRLLIDSTDDLHVVGEAATGAQAVAQAAQADVVLMDIRMPDMDGIEATATITANPRLADVKVLVLTTFETDDLILAALRAGATGFLGKGTEPEQLLHAIRTVAGGEALLSPAAVTSVIARVVAQPAPHATTGTVPSDLTDRELEITTLVGKGLSNIDIAKQLVISPATAKTHVNRAMMKTDSRDRAQLVIFAYEHGLLNT